MEVMEAKKTRIYSFGDNSADGNRTTLSNSLGRTFVVNHLGKGQRTGARTRYRAIDGRQHTTPAQRQ